MQHRWRGLGSLRDGRNDAGGSPIRPEKSCCCYGGQNTHRGESGYPLVRVVAMMALRSHVLSAFRFADFGTGETTLARGIWNEVPEKSLVIVDRNFLVKKDLIHLETSGNRHWLSRSKVNTKWAIREKLGKDDYLVEWDVQETGLPSTWTLRAIHYQKKGFPARDALDVAVSDPQAVAPEELVAAPITSAGRRNSPHDEVKTHLLDRQGDRFAQDARTAYARSCGASLSLTTLCGSRWSERPRRPASRPPESASSRPFR